MKFVTYSTSENNEPKFGFKSNESIIDIQLAATWMNEKENDNRFLSIPKSLIKALNNWDHNFSLLEVLNPFDDKYFRQALAHAINKELIATEVLSDLVKPAYGILPPGFPGYDKSIDGLKHDEQLAKDMLAKSKYSNIDDLPRIILSVPGTGGSAGLDIEVIIEMWKQTLGIDVEIQQVEWATFLQMLNKQELQFFSGLGWIADYPDPENFLDINFHSTKSTNHNGYNNEEVDKLLESARIEQDLTTRMEMYNKAERIIVDEAPWIPLWFPGDRYVLINQRVKNYKLTPMSVPKYSLVEIVD